MKSVKLKFVGFTSKVQEQGLRDIIQRNYTIIDSDDPDYVIYWVYDYEHLKYNCIRILYTSECYTPDFNDCDYAIGFDRLDFGDRYTRVPLYTLFQYKKFYDYIKQRPQFDKNLLRDKDRFCTFVVSNCFAQDMRSKLFDKLSEYKHVDSGGRFRNNIGGAVKDKQLFLKGAKFNIAGENCSYDGYATEKIVEAFAADTVPIYYGDPNIVKDFNPKAFVNVHDFRNLDEMLERVKEIDNDDDLYLSMLNEPIISPEAQVGNLDSFFSNIFDQPIENAVRRSHSMVANDYESTRKRHKFFETKIYKYYKKILNQFYRLRTGVYLTSRRTK